MALGLLLIWGMPRNQQPSQPYPRSGRQSREEDLDSEDRDAVRRDERIGSAHKLRKDEDDDYEDDDGYEEGEGYIESGEPRPTRLPDRDDDRADEADDRDDDKDDEPITEDDIMAVLDRDDLKQMESTDA
jgi:hypothetical protein